jgi:hypothetical protein
MRSILRWSHLLLGLSLLVYLFTDLRLNDTATTIYRLGVLPILALTGLWMWSQLSTAKFSDKPD